MIETTISEFHTRYCIQAIHKLAFHLPHVRILGGNHCGEMQWKKFKQRKLFQDVLCHRDYSEGEFEIFSNKIKSEYYGENRSVYIEGIILEHFSEVPQTNLNSTTPSSKHHEVFHSFLSDKINQDASTNNAHSKRFISLLNEKKVLTLSLRTIKKTLMVVPNNTDVPLNS